MDNKLINSEEVAQFIADGYLKYESIIPKSLCNEIISQVKDNFYTKYDKVGTKFKDIWNETLLGKVYKNNKVEKIIESLIGKDPKYDHHYIHIKQNHTQEIPNLHQDGDQDKRNNQFDLLILFFPQKVTLNMGGTLIIPSSHFRKISGNSIKRYQNIVGQEKITCEAGTVYLMHHNLWHAGRSNNSNNDRILIKLRLNPSNNQKLSWDYKNTNLTKIISILSKSYSWHGDQQRQEIINRIKLWRYLYNDYESEFDKELLWGIELNDYQKVIYQDSVRSIDKTDTSL